MKKKTKSKTSKKSIRTKLMVIPIILVVLSIVGIILSVTYETYTGMREHVRSDNELLLENVVLRLEDDANSIDSIEGTVDATVLSSLETIKDRNTDNLTNEEVFELANLIKVDELNIFSTDGEILSSNISGNIGQTLDLTHPLTTFISRDEELMLEEIRETADEKFDGFYKYGAIKNEDGSVFQLGVSASELAVITSQFEIQVIINDLMTSENVTYAGYLDNEYVYRANSNEDFIDENMGDTPEVVEAIDEQKLVTSNRVEADGKF